MQNYINRQCKPDKKITIEKKNYYEALQEAEDEDAEIQQNNDCATKCKRRII